MTYRGALVRLLAFTVVTTIVTGFLVRTIQGYQGDATRSYTAVFTDATKLAKGDDVRLAGVSVGRVTRVALDRDAKARVGFTVDRDVTLTSTSTARIRYRNLIGERYLALDVPLSGVRLPAGGTIPLTRTTPALDLTAVFNGFRPLFQGLDASSINALSLSLVKALQGEGGTLASLLGSTGSLGATIARHDAAIGTLVGELTTVLTTLNEHSASFNRLVTRLRAFSAGLRSDRQVVVDALAGIDDLATVTENLLGQARQPLRGVVAGTRQIATRLDDHKDMLVNKLNLLPVKLNAIMRSAQYGSWFQFYNCGIGLEVDLGSTTPPLVVPPSGPATGICGA